MTNGEALKVWLPIIHMGVENMLECKEALEMAIKALEQEPCADVISRQAVINAIANTCFWLSADNWEELMKCINSIPLVNPQEPKTDTLDKIRAEIEKKIVKRPWLDFEDRERDRNDAFLEVLDIIDKYRAETE